MFFRLSLGSARRFAALLLLMGVMLGGAVEAIACEPTTELTAIEVAPVDQGEQEQLPGAERHGDCVHGHCHHGAQQVPSIAFDVESPMMAAKHVPPREHRLGSVTLDSLKRPPRA